MCLPSSKVEASNAMVGGCVFLSCGSEAPPVGGNQLNPRGTVSLRKVGVSMPPSRTIPELDTTSRSVRRVIRGLCSWGFHMKGGDPPDFIPSMTLKAGQGDTDVGVRAGQRGWYV